MIAGCGEELVAHDVGCGDAHQEGHAKHGGAEYPQVGKDSLTTHLEAAVVLSLVLEKGCGQLRRLWYRSTGRKNLDKVLKDTCAVMSLMNPLKMVLINKKKEE